MAQSTQITGVQFSIIFHRLIQNGKQIDRVRMLATIFLQQTLRLFRNPYCHLLSCFVTAIYNGVTLYILLTQISKIDKRHPPKKEHQPEISQRTLHVLWQ